MLLKRKICFAEVVSELSVIDAAIGGIRVGEPHDFGICLILRRLIDTIRETKAEIYPPKAGRG